MKIKEIIVRESEYDSSPEVHQAKRGQLVKGEKINKIIIIPEWIIQDIESGRIK
jgi:hypothetical protein